MEVFEGGIRVPFIVRWKGKVHAGSTSHLPSTQYDMMATLAELTGQKAPPNDGITLLPELLRYRGLPPRHEYLYFEYPENGGQLAVRMDKWKGVKLQVRQKPQNDWMLFDLDKDPGESTDISAQNPDIIKRFNEIVLREHRQSHIREWEFVNPKFDVKQINN
jgi:arylsulfatase A-like enzyme